MSDFESLKKEYKASIGRKVLFILACIVFMVIAAAVSITIGAYKITPWEVYETIFNHIIGTPIQPGSREWLNDEIVCNTRLPRVIFAILAGMSLAVAGVTMQGVMKNPLAEPYTTGVSSGASLGVALSMAGIITITSSGICSALLFALIPVIVIVMISPKLNGSVATIILIGTALAYMFNAFMTLVLVSTDSETLAAIYKWQIGSLGNFKWNELPLIAAVTVSGTVIISLLTKKLNMMALGDENAKSLGLNVKRLRIVCLVVMAVMVSAIVIYAGIIGFVGLICPHIVRLIIGSDNRFILPAAGAFGAAFLLFADTVAKYLSAYDAMPVGAIVSLIGAPLFLILLVRDRRGIW